MTTVKEIYQGAERLINEILRKESFEQGHYLTGALEDSFKTEVSKKSNEDVMEGFAVYYTQFVNDGVPASSVSWKQLPFLINYFRQRGLGEKEAKSAAAATIKVWMKEGMPTQASKRFSKTGSRTAMIESAFVGAQSRIDEYMSAGFDFAVDAKFSQEKSETI